MEIDFFTLDGWGLLFWGILRTGKSSLSELYELSELEKLLLVLIVR